MVTSPGCPTFLNWIGIENNKPMKRATILAIKNTSVQLLTVIFQKEKI